MKDKIVNTFFVILTLLLYVPAKIIESLRWVGYVELDADGSQKDGEQ
jgi:hypothetical protein